MIFTSVSRLGDFLMTLPVASWYYNVYKEKIHFVLSKNFDLYEKMIPLLKYQEFTENVTLVDVGVNAFSDWNFNPNEFGISGKYFNFGFWVYPPINKWMPCYYAERYGLGVNEDFKMIYPKADVVKYSNVWMEAAPYRDTYKTLPNRVPPGSKELNQGASVILNVNLAMEADNVWTNGGGFAVLLDLIGKQQIIVKTKREYDEGDKRIMRCSFRPDHYLQHKYIFI